MVEPRQFSPYSIVHVVDSLELGGLERVTVDLAKAQRLAGHRVSVFSILSTQGLKQELVDAGIPVFEGHKSGTLDRRVIKALRQLLRQQEADVVHAHNFVPNYYSALAKMGLRHSPVQVCTCHDMGGRLSSRKLRWLFKLSLLATHEVAMVGRQVFDRYMKLGMVPSGHAHVVLNGVPVERFVGGADKRRAAREALNLVEQDLVIGCVGRLVELKNHRRMIEVMPELLQSFRHLKLVILGDGELRSELNELVANLKLSESVILAGARRNVSELLPAFDVFALPSRTEGLSIALLEACATGLAVLASDVGGNPEIILDGETGLLVAPNDNRVLRDGLTKLLADSALRERLGARAAAWVREHASDRALQVAYDQLYRVAMQRGAN